jgi:hypothetical protein
VTRTLIGGDAFGGALLMLARPYRGSLMLLNTKKGLVVTEAQYQCVKC